MEALRVETQLQQNGVLLLKNLPFEPVESRWEALG